MFLCLALAFQCENNDKNKLLKAEIVFTGLPAADGCGWLLNINDKSVSPVNLPEKFQVKGMKVDVDLAYLSTSFQCGMSPNNKIPQVEILNIAQSTE